jgi:hypothetical protein
VPGGAMLGVPGFTPRGGIVGVTSIPPQKAGEAGLPGGGFVGVQGLPRLRAVEAGLPGGGVVGVQGIS